MILRRDMSENDLQRGIVEAAERNGWRVFFIPDWVWRLIFKAWRMGGSRKGREWSQKGFPDLVMYKDRVLIFAELKSEDGRVKPEQKAWAEDLRSVEKIEVHLIRPRHYDDFVDRLSE
jgi:hypothetical protein